MRISAKIVALIFHNKRSLSLHQKQMRFFTIALVTIAALLGAVLIYLINL
jgi:hypothetical protein